MGVHLSDFGRFVEQGSRRRPLLRLLDAAGSAAGGVGLLAITYVGGVAVKLFAPDTLLDNPFFSVPFIAVMIGVGVGIPMLMVEQGRLGRLFFRRPSDLVSHLEKLSQWDRESFLRSSVYRGLLREGVPVEEIMRSLSAGVWSFDGIREVAAGAPSEWVASFEDGEALGFVSTGPSRGGVAA